MAEAVLNHKGGGRFVAHSAGSAPAARVHPLAIRALRNAGIEWQGHPPRHVSTAEHAPWDFVITVCDRAQESCPVFPGQPMLAHWGMPDPAAVLGTESAREAAFADALRLISRRIDLMLAVPVGKLKRLAIEMHLRAIGEVGADADLPGEGTGGAQLHERGSRPPRAAGSNALPLRQPPARS